MASYATKVKNDIARWVASGLVDRATGDALVRDVEANERNGLNFGSILAIMAALLFAAAILILVAANWEAIPRVARVGALFAVIFAGYVGGAVLKERGHGGFAEALWLIAAAAFGGSIALVGQMYHFSGDEAAAVVTWCVGTAIAAAALRSNALTVAAVGIADAWLVLKGFEIFRRSEFPHLFVAVMAVFWALSFWTQSRAARHLIVLSLIFYAVLLGIHYDTLEVGLVLALVSAALLAVAALAPIPSERLVQLGGRLPLHALVGFLTGLGMIQIDRLDEQGFVMAAAVALAVIAAVVIFLGRESRALRWIAYLGFAFELAVVYLVTVGSMLGTAGFFFAAAIILAGLAYAIIRIERRMKPQSPQGAA
ncbi:DUF2157 domain-containing protein [Aminobacter sp. AP02]|uniref:DUF2157 domain-containing protein n=1 Tax=Aminobacter sp. AP02 TaxID=2135737 RepID=UPI000D6C17DC|nr:DUF2157 domain-containing protein [Aminobacter sp. AP02]PWK65934.1 putative membrane protein [Aminobacter sp. AP02]